MWESRNKCLHKNEDKEYTTKETELLNDQISDEYCKGIVDLHPNYHDVFTPTEEETKQMRTPEKKRWLETIATYRKRARSDNIEGNTRKFFSTKSEVQHRKRNTRMKKTSIPKYYKWWMKWHPNTSDLLYKLR